MPPVDAVPAGAPPPLPALETPAFSVGGVVGKTFSTWSRNLVPFTALAALLSLPTFVLNLWNQYAVYGEYPGFRQIMEHARAQAAAGPFASWTPLVVTAWIAMLLLSLVNVAAFTYGAIQHLAGRPVAVGALLGAGLRSAWPVFVAGLLAGLLTFAGTLLLVVPGMIAFCAVSVAIPAVVAESKGPVDGIRRSFALTKGRRFSIWLAFLVMGLIVWTVSMAAGLLPMALGGGTASLLGAVVAFAAGAVATPLMTLLPAVAYHDLRVAKEGVDTSELARVFE